jgi:hypothetical protein
VVKKRSIFWDITPRSMLKVNPRFGGTCHLSLVLLTKYITLVSRLAKFLILKTEATYFSET